MTSEQIDQVAGFVLSIVDGHETLKTLPEAQREAVLDRMAEMLVDDIFGSEE